MVLSVIIGALLQVDPALPELASRTRVALGDVAVALASGCAVRWRLPPVCPRRWSA